MSRVRDLLHQLADAVADQLEQRGNQARFYDQDDSPLPAATHCRLVRTGALPGFKRHGRVLVERAIMDRYIEQGRVDASQNVSEEDAAVEAALKRFKRTG
jgi:hypothetical protein